MRRRMLSTFCVLLMMSLGGAAKTKADSCEIGELCQVTADLPNCTNGAHVDFHAVEGNWFLGLWDPNWTFIQGTDGKCTDSNGCDLADDITPIVFPHPPIAHITLQWRVKNFDDNPFFYDAYCL